MLSKQKNAGVLALALLTLALTTACGREDKVYPDSAPDSSVVIDSQKHLPEGFFDHSVNRGLVRVGLDLPANAVLALQTDPGTNAPGSFNGDGTGNRALLGLADFNEAQLTELNPITLDLKIYAGDETLTLLLQVDLTCDSSQVRTFFATQEALNSGAADDAGYTRFSADFFDSVWQVDGADLMDPADSTIVLVSGTSAGSKSSLSTFLSRYPNACIRNFISSQSDLPKDVPTSGVLFALGTENTSSQNVAFLRRITLGSAVFEKLQWSTP